MFASFFGLFYAPSIVTGVCPRDTSTGVSQLLFVICSDCRKDIIALRDSTRQHFSDDLVGCGSGLDLLSGWVIDQTLLNLGFTLGEEVELWFVRVKSLSVKLELFLACLSASVINSDAKISCKSSAQFSSSELSESESAALPDLTSIFKSHWRDDRPEFLNESGEHFFSIPFVALMSPNLLCLLIEVNFDSVDTSVLPVLAQMDA